MEEKRNINVGRVCLGDAVYLVIYILLCVFLAKIFSFIGWFGFEYGWFRNPRCWAFVIGVIIITFAVSPIGELIKYDTCRIHTEPTILSKVFHILSIIIGIIAVIVMVVQFFRLFYWGGFSASLLLAFVPGLKISIVEVILVYASYIFGKEDKNIEHFGEDI